MTVVDEFKRMCQEAACNNPEFLRRAVGRAIKDSGDKRALSVWRRVNKRERKAMTAHSTMNGYGAGIAVQKLTDAGFGTRPITVRPRSWSNKFFAVEVETPTPFRPFSDYEGTFGRWVPGMGYVGESEARKAHSSAVTEKKVFYTTEAVEAYIIANKPKPVEVVAIVEGSKFRFPIGGMGSGRGMVWNPKGKVNQQGEGMTTGQRSDWTLAEVKAHGGLVTQDGILYKLLPPVDLFS